jgi:hypothetical protein
MQPRRRRLSSACAPPSKTRAFGGQTCDVVSRKIEGDGDVFPYHLLTRHHQSIDGLRIDGRRKSDSLRNPWEVSLISMNGLVRVSGTRTSTIYIYIYIYI